MSALLAPGQNRFTALRSFVITTSTDGTTFTKAFRSTPDAFPAEAPRPVTPELNLRTFRFSAVAATHVRIEVVANQCTGNAAFQGEQDADPLNGTDCREGSPGGGTVAVFGDLPQVVAPRDNEVHIAELQVAAAATGGGRKK